MKVKYLIPILIGVVILFNLAFGNPYLIPTPSNDYLISTNYTCFGCDAPNEPTILILLSIIIPILVLIGFIIKYIPDKKKKVEPID